jgi:DNA repair protein RadC
VTKKNPPTKSAITKSSKKVSWRHPGGKFRRLGPQSCTDAELLAILISTGMPGKSAESIAEEILDKHHSLVGIMGKTLQEIMKVKGLKIVKATRIASAFEIARRIVKELEKQ